MRKTFFLLFPILLAACSGNGDAPANDSTDSTGKPMAVTDMASDWQSLTESWTASLNLKNASIMKSFYADSVDYYGDRISGADVVKRQQEYFAANPDYKQKIVEYISEDQLPDGNWRIRITKQVTAGGKTAHYPASLVYAKQNGIWKIIVESDDITDLRKAQPVTVHYAPESVTVTGLLEENTALNVAPGSDPKSDGKQVYYVIWSAQPLDVVATGRDAQPSEMGVERIQLQGDAGLMTALLNKKVRATGTLFHADKPEHYTKVLMQVKELSAVD